MKTLSSKAVTTQIQSLNVATSADALATLAVNLVNVIQLKGTFTSAQADAITTLLDSKASKLQTNLGNTNPTIGSVIKSLCPLSKDKETGAITFDKKKRERLATNKGLQFKTGESECISFDTLVTIVTELYTVEETEKSTVIKANPLKAVTAKLPDMDHATLVEQIAFIDALKQQAESELRAKLLAND